MNQMERAEQIATLMLQSKVEPVGAVLGAVAVFAVRASNYAMAERMLRHAQSRKAMLNSGVAAGLAQAFADQGGERQALASEWLALGSPMVATHNTRHVITPGARIADLQATSKAMQAASPA